MSLSSESGSKAGTKVESPSTSSGRKEAIMARIVLTAVLVILLNVLVGCYGIDSGKSQLATAHMQTTPVVEVAGAGEADIIEHVAINRQAYRQGVEMLVDYYNKTGNNLKLTWAKDELSALNGIAKSQYNYVVEADVAGPDLRATTSITEADYMYDEAVRDENRARGLLVVVDDNLLRVASDKYRQLIKKYPSSDKIDDAAFRIAGIAEHFKDYSIALLYYQRANQWNPDITSPARFKAAFILDTIMSRRSEALELYTQALEKESLSFAQQEFAKKRIAELSKSIQSGEKVD